MSNYLLIVDGTNLLNRCYYADSYKRYSKNNIPTNAVEGFLKCVLSLLKNQKPSHIAFCFDTGSRGTFRKVLYDGYKSTRKESPSDLKAQYTVIEDILKSAGFPVFVSDRSGTPDYIFEGDDYCGTIATKMRYKIPKIVLLSRDQDYLQLLNSSYDSNKNFCETVVWMNTNKAGDYFRECGIKSTNITLPYNTFEYTASAYKTLTGMNPEQIIEYKGIVGDSSDTIPGVLGIGPKIGKILLSKYKTVSGIYNAIDSSEGIEQLSLNWKSELGIKNSKSLIEKLLSGRDMAYLSKKLGTIKTDIPLDISIEDLKLNINVPAWNKELNNLGLYNLTISEFRI